MLKIIVEIGSMQFDKVERIIFIIKNSYKLVIEKGLFE